MRSGDDADPERLIIACAVTAGLVVLVLAVLVTLNLLTAIDTRGILAVRGLASPGTTAVMQAASTIGHGRVAVPAAILIALAVYRVADARTAAIYVGACLTGELLMLLIKEAVHHRRPVGISPKLTDAGFYSFPSGHTMLAVIVFGLGAFLLSRQWQRFARTLILVAAAILIILIGISRIYLGAHWPSDVIAAAFAGLGWASVAVALNEKGGGAK